MATFPTFETTLIKVANALGALASSDKFSTKTKTKFKTNELNMPNMFSTWEMVLNKIFDALELSEVDRRDLIVNIKNDHDIHKMIELKVFTNKASKQKVVWHYLSRVLIPALARHTVFWQIESKMDEGMPGGKFWYLPFLNPNENNPKIQLPVQEVLDWLVDLIEEPKAAIARELETELRIYESSGNLLRNLYNWQQAKNTPEISSINTTFPDEVTIDFKGCFEPHNDECLFEQAIEFVYRKGHTPQTLQYEIAISETTLKSILNKNCEPETEADFVAKIQERYQRPSTKAIRIRLMVARAIQDGYEELVKFLSKGQCSTSEAESKVMQLVRLYEMTYNLTLQAHFSCGGMKPGREREKRENQLFTLSLPGMYRYDLLLCVASEEYHTVELVAPRLNEIFSEVNKEDHLQDIYSDSPSMFERIELQSFEHRKQRNGFYQSIEKAKERLLQNKAPYKLLREVDDFDFVYELSKFEGYSQHIKSMLFSRLKELEIKPEEQLKRIMIELDFLLAQSKFDKNSEKQISQLISMAYENPEMDLWKAYVLKFDGHHHIAQNKFKDAEKLLKKAVDECKKVSFGSLRGELARDAFALAISNQKLIPNNHETYFKEMIFWGGWDPEQESDSFNVFDTSRNLHEYFWQKLYQPYPGYQPVYSDSKKDFETFFKDFAPCLKGNIDIKPALRKHKHLKNKQLKSPQSDSIMLLLLKITYDMQAKASLFERQMRHTCPPEQMEEIKSIWCNQLDILRQVVKEWPEIVNISDFKNQTPLMMAVHNDDYETAKVLLEAGAELNKQDIKGRTALHSACASRTLQCAKLLVEHGINGQMTSIEGATALHTAVRMGEVEIVEYLSNKFPELFNVKEFEYRTPLMLAKKIAECSEYYDLLVAGLRAENRSVVSQQNYKTIYKFLVTHNEVA